MRSIFALFAMLSFSCLAADVSGNWKGTAESQNGTIERTFSFKVNGAKLTGETVSSTAGKSTIIDGKVDGDKVSFTINLKIQDNEMTVKYSGVVSGDSLKLDAEIAGFDQKMVFDVKRVK